MNKSQVVIKKSHSEANLEAKAAQPYRMINKKEKSLDQLARSLSDRISIDRLATKKLGEMSEEQMAKR